MRDEKDGLQANAAMRLLKQRSCTSDEPRFVDARSALLALQLHLPVKITLFRAAASLPTND